MAAGFLSLAAFVLVLIGWTREETDWIAGAVVLLALAVWFLAQ